MINKLLQSVETSPLSELAALALLAASVSGAREVRLVFRDAVDDTFRTALVHAGVDVAADPKLRLHVVAAGQRFSPVLNTDIPTGLSDEVNVRLPVRVEAQGVTVALDLDRCRADVMSTVRSMQLSHIGMIMGVRLQRMQSELQASCLTALNIIDAMSEMQDDAASRTLTGLLRVLAKTPPRSVEVTALRIAGLAELVDGDLHLTDEARGILARLGGVGPDRTLLPRIALNSEWLEELHAQEGVVPADARGVGEVHQFSCLKIGEAMFDIGECADVEGQLAFRRGNGAGEWLTLSNKIVDGWTEIAAEVISRTQDVIQEYVLMHMIRRRDVQVDEGVELFNLYGIEWHVMVRDGRVLARIKPSDWAELPGSARLVSMPSRDRAVVALREILADLDDQVGRDAKAWAHRMALGATVMPYFGVAA